MFGSKEIEFYNNIQNEKDYDPRDGGTDSHRRGLDICLAILKRL